ncbi:ABC transporter permease [Heyndrickxia sporothermodurans]
MLRNIYFKEMKDCFRDRRTLLLTVLVPIVMMTALTLFYDKMLSSGKGETYDLAVNSTITKDAEDIFSKNKNIKLVKYANPENAINDGKAQAALIISPDFADSIQKGEQVSVKLFGDSFSQKSSDLMNVVTNTLSIYEKSIITERLNAKGMDSKLIQPFKIEKKEISEDNPGLNLMAMLIPLILAIAIGVGASPAAADLFAGEKERKTMEALLMTPVKRSVLLLSKWLTISSVAAITGFITLIVVALEITYLTDNIKNAVSFGDNVYQVIGIAIFISIIYAMFVASFLMFTSIIGKTVKEAQSYSTPILMIAAFPGMVTSSIGINELTIKHFAIPILNLFSVLKELIFGIINVEHILIMIVSNLICIVVLFIIGRILFLKDKWVMN